MALRDQPYLPLYVQDFLTDEKLALCSASATGVYIRLMCIMHKSDDYGTILLKQKDKQKETSSLNFASKVAKMMPYSDDVIHAALIELIDENVLEIDGDRLIQKRMVNDEKISVARSVAGKKGYKAKKKSDRNFARAFAKAKPLANAENENEIENQLEEKYSNEQKENFQKFQDFILKEAPNVAKMKEPFTIDQFISLKEKFPGQNKLAAEKIKAMHNKKGLTSEYRSAYLTCISWMKRELDNK